MWGRTIELARSCVVRGGDVQRLKGMSIQTAVRVAAGAVTLLAIAVMGYLWVAQEQERFEVNAEQQRHEFVESQKAMVSAEVEKAIDYIAYRRAQGEARLRAALQGRVGEAWAIANGIHEKHHRTLPRKHVEEMIKDALRPIRFNSGRGYYFVVTMDGVEILFPVAPYFEGRNLLDLRDDQGRYVIRDEVELMRKQSEGFIVSHWQKPGSPDGMVHPKMVFLKRFEPLNWYLGTGEYLDDFERDLQEELLDRISNIRFGEEGYVFVNTYNGDALITDGLRVRERRNLWELTDPNGVKVIQEERRAVEKPEGDFIYYTWNRLTRAEPARKVSFIKGVPDWSWMIGAGVYLDEVDQAIESQRLESQRQVRSQIARILLIALSLGVAVLAATHLISRWTHRGVAAFLAFFERAATESATIDETRLPFSEFRALARAANAMVRSRQRAEEETRALQEELLRARKMEALGLLAGGVAHDLNNILSGVVLYPDLLLAQLPADSPLRRPLEAIRESGERAGAVVSDLLTASRGGAASSEVLRLDDAVKGFLETSELHALAARHPRVRVRAELESDSPAVRCSPAHLTKMLLNLVANGMEAIQDEGEVEIRTARYVLAEARRAYEVVPPGEYAVLAVRDTGSGIPEGDLGRIFDPFFTRKVLGRKGTGLGLTVVWHTVHDHGGFIDVRSGSEGTTIELWFPACHEPLTGERPPLTIEELHGCGERILVVDDEPHQRELALELLVRLGYRAEAVATGEEAVERVRHEPFDLLILDMILGSGMDGRATYAAVLESRPGQKAIVASGYAETEDIRETLAMGAGASVLKPYTLERMGQAIKRELARE